MACLLRGATVILPDRLIDDGALRIDAAGRIAEVGEASAVEADGAPVIDVDGGYLAPGYVDLHCHGGDGADFMDGTAAAFRTTLDAHLRHGTTTMAPTTTVARHEQILAALEVCAAATQDGGFGLYGAGAATGSRVAGAHFYGPYFGPGAQGCHPAGPVRSPVPEEFESYLSFGGLPEGGAIACASVAPEVPGAEAFARAAGQRGIRLHAGHSNATLSQVEASLAWGVGHVDHLYCAMSDKTKLRQQVAYPMQGGLLEATLLFDELSTEVIADGKHLDAGLLRLAFKQKGADRLALVTDCNRALDRPDGEYLFGPSDGGEPFVRRDDVGVMPDGSALASSCQGMDHMVRTFHELTGAPLPEVVRMASLTPARILGVDARLGSLEPGKMADVLVLDEDLRMQRVFLQGREIR